MLLTLITAVYLPQISKELKEETSSFFDYLSRLVESWGILFTIQYVKTSRNCVCRFISGRPLDNAENVSLREGWPVWLLPFKEKVLSDTGALRLLMSLLVSLRGFKTPAKLDLDPIVSTWKGTDTISTNEFRTSCWLLGIGPREVEWRNFHMSTKRGPLGQALLTSVSELTLLPDELTHDLVVLAGDKLGSKMEALKKPSLGEYSIVGIWSWLFPPKTGNLRRLSFFSDKEGKTRTIAILDYWSQTALRPLHYKMYDMLRKLGPDCTYDQNKFRKVLPTVGPYFSFDLSNATDRMPLLVQKRVVSVIAGEDRAEAWSRILVGHEFVVAKTGQRASYAAGQPMGAYSSWCAMALTHHLLVQVSALWAKLSTKRTMFKDYCLLGDDIVIANAAVAEEYRKLLAQLDMPISEAKTHVSVDTYEFAKRWIHWGVEITGFSVSGLFGVWKRYSLLHNFLESQHHHGWILDIDRHPDLIRAIYRAMLGNHFVLEKVNRVVALYMVFDSIHKGLKTGDWVSSLLAERLNLFFGLEVIRKDQSVHWTDLPTQLKCFVVEAKWRLVERDLEKFQTDAYIVNDRLNKSFSAEFPGLSGQDYRALLRENHPMIVVLNSLIDGSMNLLMELLDPERDKTALYLEAGLSKYHVSKGVFSMRASHSISLAESMVTKSVLGVIKDFHSTKWSPDIPLPSST